MIGRVSEGFGRACIAVFTSGFYPIDTIVNKTVATLLSGKALKQSLVSNHYKKSICMVGDVECFSQCAKAIPCTSWNWNNEIGFFADEVAARKNLASHVFKNLTSMPKQWDCSTDKLCKAACSAAIETPKNSDLEPILLLKSDFDFGSMLQGYLSATSGAVALASISDTILGHFGLESSHDHFDLVDLAKESLRFGIGITVASMAAPMLGGIAINAAFSYTLYNTLTAIYRIAYRIGRENGRNQARRQ